MYVFELHVPGSLSLGFPRIVLPGLPAPGMRTLHFLMSSTGADGPTATLRIVEGDMVECAGGSERAWFFSAEEPSEAGGVLSVPIDVKRTGDKAWIGYNVLDSLMGDD